VYHPPPIPEPTLVYSLVLFMTYRVFPSPFTCLFLPFPLPHLPPHRLLSHLRFSVQTTTKRPNGDAVGQTSASGSWRSWSAPSSPAITRTSLCARRSPCASS
jgi:hypothetical protein